jgi:hypothetical protein
VQFALGNIALALESFRKAVREDPRNIDAMTGLAASYDRMGRYDLSRKHYEAALAVEPANASVLAALAASLELQGKSDEAATVRKEIRQRLAAAAIPADPAKPIEAIALLAPTIVATPIPTQHQNKVDTTQTPVTAVTAVRLPAQAPAKRAAVPMSLKATTVASAPVVAAAAISPASPARSVTIKLPPPRAVVASPPRETVVAVTKTVPPAPAVRKPEQPIVAAIVTAAAPPVPASPAVRPPSPVTATFAAGPRLERTSMAEVSLITRGAETLWKPQLVQRTAQSSTVRFVPLRQAQARVAIRVLNAARVHRLAANTRLIMARRGWNNVVIGNSRMARTHSLILYPARSRLAAQQLAAQLGFASALQAQSRQVTVLLGRDATRLVRKRTTA